MAQPQTRLSIDRFVLRTPVIGRLARDVAVARFARTMGTLVGAGLPVLAALRGTRATVGNKAMEAALDEVSEAVQAGKTIAEPMERAGGTGGRQGLFPPMLTQIVGVGERTGRLAEMLQRAAVVFEEKTETSIKVVTTLVPPVLVVGAAGVVGFVMAGVLLALLEVQNSIK
jgi:type IV pilus assembly protein PilC